MGRPRRVRYDTFHLYDKLHTKKIKMFSGVEVTTLYPVKETPLFYRSIEIWGSLSSMFKAKKPFTLEVNIPVTADEKTISFLKKHAWEDWVEKEKASRDSDTLEAVSLLGKLFPDKKPVYFYELSSLISTYAFGTFISYDEEGNVEKVGEHALKDRKYYNSKYHRFSNIPEIVKMRNRWTSEQDPKKKDQYLTEYIDFENEYNYKHDNLIDVFIKIGASAVCYPVAFSKGTAEWSIKEYGKEIAYAKAGEIYFIQTPDRVYFEIKRHY